MPRKTKGTRTNRKTKPADLPDKFKAGFLMELDGRTELSRLLRGNYEAIVADVGGGDQMSHVKSALVERFVWLEAILQNIENDLATGSVEKGAALSRWIQAVNSLSGLAKVLGVERKSVHRPWLGPATQEENSTGEEAMKNEVCTSALSS